MRRTLLSCALLLAAGHAAASTAWVSNEKDNSLSLIDMQTLTVTETLPVGQRPRLSSSTRTGSRLWASAEIGGTVTILDRGHAPAIL
ncbi:hypothetical protein M1B34_33205, partial [Pseudomonas sp. MAFF 302030]|nr:hypothetical protein [Pseudomonas morbosilactucae]